MMAAHGHQIIMVGYFHPHIMKKPLHRVDVSKMWYVRKLQGLI
jgi:hypothetical protein